MGRSYCFILPTSLALEGSLWSSFNRKEKFQQIHIVVGAKGSCFLPVLLQNKMYRLSRWEARMDGGRTGPQEISLQSHSMQQTPNLKQVFLTLAAYSQ